MTTLRCRTCGREFSEGEQFCSQDGTNLHWGSASTSDDAAESRPAGTSGDPLVGSMLGGRYRILRVIGEGGMGVVYEALHVLIEKHVAIKVLRETFTGRLDVVERFRQEAKSASKIGHPNIVDVSDFGETPSGQSYIVMEMLVGEDLADVLARERVLTPSRSVRIAYQVARALHATHKKGIVHRDLKPENIYLVERDGVKDVVKIVDFGVAKMNDIEVRPGRRLTRTGMLFGTPEYMSPEQSQGKPFDHRVDVYALGAILFELLTGRVPFIGENFMEILSHHGHSPLPTLRSVNSAVQASPELEAVVRRALAKEPGDRYDSMGAFADELRSVPELTESGLRDLSLPSDPPSAPTPLNSPPPLRTGADRNRSTLEVRKRHVSEPDDPQGSVSYDGSSEVVIAPSPTHRAVRAPASYAVAPHDERDTPYGFDPSESDEEIDVAQEAVLVAPGRSLNTLAKVGMGLAVLGSGMLAASILQRSQLSLPRVTSAGSATTSMSNMQEVRPAVRLTPPLAPERSPSDLPEPPGDLPSANAARAANDDHAGTGKAAPPAPLVGGSPYEPGVGSVAGGDFVGGAPSQGALISHASPHLEPLVEIQVRTLPRGASVSVLGTSARCEPSPCALLVPRDRPVTLRAELRNTSMQRTYTFTSESEVELRVYGSRGAKPTMGEGGAAASKPMQPPHAPSDLKVPSIFR